MNVLCIGDVVGTVGCDFLRRHLPNLKRLKKIDAVIVNGENSADSNGITPHSADRLFEAGADCVTTGNHCFKRRESYDMYDGNLPVIRPANFPDSVPGRGVEIIDLGRLQLRVINLMGNVRMHTTLRSPFKTMDELLS
ncbi:MAG: YmdB family metallophosphoesterase, partial [Ruminococcaceae bacterium]|nr:YmdB family metallophosphoesterase [Oscillospiraceae bacterium]